MCVLEIVNDSGSLEDIVGVTFSLWFIPAEAVTSLCERGTVSASDAAVHSTMAASGGN